ncbi:DUF87 domain-containing protein [Natroniella acetigena]|uniref:helicase HerA domain-containing protein n=1 Tax=Natroniella acetigena TaxID=52004 RepID=UPI00200B11D1|nr:DUF87 domain-containing protein [Natroniella acetigena]MCK8826593.1 DUF87 domain-containing protein [Natroniella acetigena]
MEQEKYVLDFISNEDNYYLVDNQKLELSESKELTLQDFAIYHIEELTFEDDEGKSPRKEAFENVISALRLEGVSFLYLILGDKEGVHFYFGVVRDLNDRKDLDLNIRDIGEEILKPSIRGNFRGSKISEVEPEPKLKIKEQVEEMNYYGFLEGVPGINEDSEDFQGVDRLIDVMLGDEFGLAIIANPLNREEITEIEKKLYDTYSQIVPLANKSVQEGESEGKSEGKTITKNSSKTKGESYSKGSTESETSNENNTEGTSTSTAKGTSKTTETSSGSKGETNNASEGTTESKTWGKSETQGTSTTEGTSRSETTGESVAESNTVSKSKNNTVTLEFLNKEAQDWMDYLDEAILPRLDYGKSKGVFVSTAFLFANNKGSLIKLANTMKSLYSGKSGNKVSLKFNCLEEGKKLDYLKNFQLPSAELKNLSKNESNARTAMSQYLTKKKGYVGNWLSTNELSLIAGLPQKEVVGLSLKEEVEFGLNFKSDIADENKIYLGNLVQSGRVLENIDVFLDQKNLNKHTFITGVTGSGKTTTCQKLLLDSELPFLVIEPAKTEYRILTEEVDDLKIFTLGKDTVAPFRLNPFEFFPHESITSRVDMIKASLEAAFDMEAAIPQILETAIYECYQDLGWNIATNKNERYDDPFADGVYAFPTLENLVDKIEEVVNQQGFDERLKNDYIGSIKARLQGLLVGSKGLMLNTKRSIDFERLLDNKVVLELEEIKSGSEKSLIMGFILSDLVEAIKAKYLRLKGTKFKHITLLEEAHRLLSKYTPGDSLNKKKGVEVFSDMLAEVRKYGESLIIVDQIPNKLTPEVLKNTSTKIVHKIFAQDDKEAVGNTIALTDEQKNFMSNLVPGRAIVATQGWNKPLQVQIEQRTDTTKEEIIPEDELRENILKFYQKIYQRGVIQGIENLEEEPSVELLESFIKLNQSNTLVKSFENFTRLWDNKVDLKKKLEEAIENYGLAVVSDYLTNKFYMEKDDCSLEERKEAVKGLIEGLLSDEKVSILRKEYSCFLRRS